MVRVATALVEAAAAVLSQNPAAATSNTTMSNTRIHRRPRPRLGGALAATAGIARKDSASDGEPDPRYGSTSADGLTGALEGSPRRRQPSWGYLPMAFDHHHAAAGTIAGIHAVDDEIDRDARLAGGLREARHELGGDVDLAHGELRQNHAELRRGRIKVEGPRDRSSAKVGVVVDPGGVGGRALHL